MPKHALPDTDFSQVRVHQGADAGAAVNAQAYTAGHDIQFAPGADAPGQHLIAHEAAHVVQQRQGRVAPGAIEDAVGHYGD